MLNQDRSVGCTENNRKKKICKYNWKIKGSWPKKIMESHWSHVRRGPLLQLIVFTHPHQEKEASFSLCPDPTWDSLSKPWRESRKAHTVRDYHSQPWTSFCFLFWITWVPGKVEVYLIHLVKKWEICSLSSYKKNKGKEKSTLMQSELIFIFFFFHCQRCARHCFLPSVPLGLTIKWCLDLVLLQWSVRNHLCFQFCWGRSHISSVGAFSLLPTELANSLFSS